MRGVYEDRWEKAGGIAPLLSLVAGYAGPPITQRAPFGPAGRRRSLEEAPRRRPLSQNRPHSQTPRWDW